MTRIFIALVLFGFNLKAADRVAIGVIEASTKGKFEVETISDIRDQSRVCPRCQFINLASYDENGDIDLSALPQQIEKAADQVQIIYFKMNTKNTPALTALVNSLRRAVQKNVIVVSEAGLAQNNEDTVPLKKTVIAQVPRAIIIGELNDRERLSPKSYYGPEMLTALRPSRDIASVPRGLLFTAKLGQNYNKKTPSEWYTYLARVKSTTRKIWPGLEDFFKL